MEWSHLSEIQSEPVSIEEAITCPDSSKWIKEMEAEMRYMQTKARITVMQDESKGCTLISQPAYTKNEEIWHAGL